MLKKTYTATGKKCRVTFHYADSGAASAALAGEFNGWSATETPMKRLKSGEFAVTLMLDAGRDYAFRYVVDGQRWVNEPEADKYVRNEFGEDNSVVTVPLPE
ncbi:isoamylase early set domain-containing protein [Candidatus Electronema sp. JM]|uniref:isoamylase early set domain-containing protein n=1 Tax=Candidatus Electronema sp. JM TaxID=3401571 RepID=UPI003AA9613D